MNRLLRLDCLLQNLVVIRSGDFGHIVFSWPFLVSDCSIGWKHRFGDKDLKLFRGVNTHESTVTGFAVEKLIQIFSYNCCRVGQPDNAGGMRGLQR